MAYEKYQHWKTTRLTEKPYLSVIIPAYNEEERIVPTIGAIAAYVSTLDFPWELIVADDGSTDQTTALVEELGFANLRLLKAKQNGGKGSAVQRGMLAARGKFILFTDADNSTPIEQVEKLLRELTENGYDIAVGSRVIEGAQEAKRSLLRRILSGGLRLIVKYIIKIGVRDTQCGFKLYRRQAARQLHGNQTEMGFAFDLEILYLATKYGYQVSEVPVEWIDAPGSKVDTRKEAQRFLKTLFKIKLTDWRGGYRATNERRI